MQYLVRINQIVTQEQYDALQQVGLLPFKSVAEESISIEDIDEIIKDVIVDHLKISRDAFTRTDRRMANATARFFRSTYLYKYTSMTLSECGQYCGYNDHTSVIYSREQVEKLTELGENASVYRKYSVLADDLDTILKEHLSQKQVLGLKKIVPPLKNKEHEVII
jgi:chromosomal replication initiation ATPase DnaA